MESSKERSEEYKEGTSTLFVHSGLDEQRWGEAKARCCYSRNIQELPVDGKTHVRKKIRHSNPWASSAFWSRDTLSSNFHRRQKQASPFSSQVLASILIGYASERGERLDGRLMRGRCRRIERQHRIIIFTSKDSEKKKGNSKRRRTKFTFPCANGSTKSA